MNKRPSINILKDSFTKLNNGFQDYLDSREEKLRLRIQDKATSGPSYRSKYLRIIFALGFSLLGLRAAQIALFRPVDVARTEARADAQNTFNRADILDRNGVLIATSLPAFSLYADPAKIWDAKETAAALVTVFPDLNEAELVKKLSSEKRFVWIKRRLTPQQKKKVWDLAQPGLEFEDDMRRVYPMGSLAGHILGGVNHDGNGLTGLEKALQDFLTTGNKDSAVNISIDTRVQYIVEKELAEAAVKYRAKNGVAAIMDVRTGEMIAAASWPSMDPNRYGANSPYARENRLISSVYEMGSTFKAFTFAVALNDGNITPESQFDASRPIKIGDWSISDYHGANKILSSREVLEHSSNIGTALIAREIGAQRIKSFYEELGLTGKVGGELYGAAHPILPKKWGVIQSITASYGHGIAVSPLAELAAYTAVTNGGIYLKPTFLAREENAQVSGRRVISSEASKQITSLLRDVVTSGTGANADTEFYDVAGKTGTAEKATKKGYDANRRVSSFAGVFPASNPRYSFVFLLDEPNGINGGAATAGLVCAPSVSKIITRIGPMLNMEPTKQVAVKTLINDNPQSKILANKPQNNIAIGAR